MTKTLEYLYPKHPFLEQIHNHLKFSAEVTDSVIREFKQTKYFCFIAGHADSVLLQSCTT